MKQLSYEDQRTLLALSINVFQSGVTSYRSTSDGSSFRSTKYSPPAVKKLEMFCTEKLGLEVCRELYYAWLEDEKEGA